MDTHSLDIKKVILVGSVKQNSDSNVKLFSMIYKGRGNYLAIIESRVRVMVFNATFNNISVISWWSILLVEET